MSLTSQLDRYLRVRRSLGYDLGTSERILRRFTRFADHEGADHIDTALFLRWHTTLAEACSSTRVARLSFVRLFAQWLSSFDPAHEVPPRGLLPGSYKRSRPHIYTDAEVGAIITAAKALPSIYGLRGLTCSTLFGLIAVTGLRRSRSIATTSTSTMACCACDKASSAKSVCCRSTRASSRSWWAMLRSATG